MPAELQGLETLLRRVRETVADADQIEEKALQRGAEIIKDEASSLAPTKTTNLQSNIVISQVKDKKIEIGPSDKAFYSTMVELGTSQAAAQPFLGPALANKKGEVENAMKEELRRGLGL